MKCLNLQLAFIRKFGFSTFGAVIVILTFIPKNLLVDLAKILANALMETRLAQLGLVAIMNL